MCATTTWRSRMVSGSAGPVAPKKTSGAVKLLKQAKRTPPLITLPQVLGGSR